MPNSFVVDVTTKKLFAGRTLLLDTNALLDAYRLPAEFYDLANEFAKLGCDLVTTKSIALVSRNHKDFSARLTKRISFITLLGSAEIHTYGIYAHI